MKDTIDIYAKAMLHYVLWVVTLFILAAPIVYGIDDNDGPLTFINNIFLPEQGSILNSRWSVASMLVYNVVAVIMMYTYRLYSPFIKCRALKDCDMYFIVHTLMYLYMIKVSTYMFCVLANKHGINGVVYYTFNVIRLVAAVMLTWFIIKFGEYVFKRLGMIAFIKGMPNN